VTPPTRLEWKVIHLTSGMSTTPDTSKSSPKRRTSMPRAACAAKSMPLCRSSSMLSRAYMSSATLNSLRQARA